MRDVFNRHADCNSNQALSAPALMTALKEVEAPVLHSSVSTEDNIFRRADTNLSGAVDFEECEKTMHWHLWEVVIFFLQGSCERLSCRTSWRCFWRTTAFRYQFRMLTCNFVSFCV